MRSLESMRLPRLWTDQGKRAEHGGLHSVLSTGLAAGSDFDEFFDTQGLTWPTLKPQCV
jgi:hypothetical protein